MDFKKLELRMYGLTPYQLSGIQIGIQFGHAVVEYGQNVKSYDIINNIELKKYNDWADIWKTFIILNGGVSNHSQNRYHDGDFIGSMELNLGLLEQNGIEIGTFYEPDLNDMLSAIVFIVDERVFKTRPLFDGDTFYQDFEDWVLTKHPNSIIDFVGKVGNSYETAKYIKTSVDPEYRKIYQEWVDFIGGEGNVFLRSFLKNFKLA